MPVPLIPCRALIALAQQLASLNGLLCTAELNSALAGQLRVACLAIASCALLSDRLPLQHTDAFRLGSSLATVFGAGLRLLRSRVAIAGASSAQLAAMLHEADRQLGAVSCMADRIANPQQQPEAAAAFVKTVGRTQAVLPWLSAVSQALLAVPPDMTNSWLGLPLGAPSVRGEAAAGWLPARAAWFRIG